jgi:cell division protein FtsI (penicillin-binding protein 3)
VIRKFGRAVTRQAQGWGSVREPDDWRLTVKRRSVVAAGAMVLWVAAIEGRLVYLQVVRYADLAARAEQQQMRTRVVPAKRGDILDRRGRVLATSADADSIYAVPSELNAQPATVAGALCDALGDCSNRDRQTLIERLGRARDHFEWVRRQVSPEVAARVAALNLPGVSSMKESRRFYPKKELAAHLLGYVGVDNTGLAGIESAYDSQIRGKPGTVFVQSDARRHAFSRLEQPPTAGSSVELTIDEYLQHLTERELRAGIRAHRAEGGSAIVMNPRTGEILAMANEPTFNPNVYREFSETARRNRAVQDLYEPGSTFKIVTASAAIDEKVVPLDSWIDTSPGIIRIGNTVVDEYDHHNYGTLSFTDVIVRSSNIGAIKIGFKIGTERLSRYVASYGFGGRVAPDFPGESPGIVWRPEDWTERALASVSMGYQIAVTPLQVAAAFGAVANGGDFVEPRVLRAVYRDGRRYSVTPKILRRTITPDTAAALITIMEQVVERGTGRPARVPGYTIAGKTGTASKLINGRYSASQNNVSFAGFLPSRDPVATIVVVVDAPRAGGRSGAVVAAPIFQRIAEGTMRYLRVSPTLNPDPPVIVPRRPDMAAPASVDASHEAALTLVSSQSGDPGRVPDVRGLSAREATRELMKRGIAAHLTGSGFVFEQDPPAGAPLDQTGICRLVLARTPGEARKTIRTHSADGLER